MQERNAIFFGALVARLRSEIQRAARVGCFAGMAVLVAGGPAGRSAWGAEGEKSQARAEVIPTTVAFPPTGGNVQAMLVLRNPTEEALTDITIDVFPESFERDTIIDYKPGGVVLPNDESTWLIHIPDSLPHPVPAKMHIRIAYKTRAKAGQAASVSAVTSATIDIAQRAPENIDNVASAAILTPIETLKDNEERDVYISVTNKSNTEIEVCEIKPTQLSSFSVKQKTKEEANKAEVVLVPLPAQVAPNETKLFPLKVTASDQVTPGKETLSLNVGLKWGAGGQGNILLKKEITLGVFGESEILTALGVPSFLMLPGYLIIVTAIALRPSKPAATTITKWQQIVRPEILVLAITLSGAMMYGYAHFTDRDYTVSYGMRDVVNVWLTSVAIGAGCALLVCTARWVGATCRRMWNWWFRPSPGDSEIVTLKKLHRRGRGFHLPVTSQVSGTVTRRLFQLDPNMKWVAPCIMVGGLKSEQPEATELEQLLNREQGNAKDLADILKRGQDKYKWNVRWKAGSGPKEEGTLQFDETAPESMVEKS